MFQIFYTNTRLRIEYDVEDDIILPCITPICDPDNRVGIPFPFRSYDM